MSKGNTTQHFQGQVSNVFIYVAHSHPFVFFFKKKLKKKKAIKKMVSNIS
jgi:hypothetical protein